MRMTLPNFLVIGAAKSGTTSLYQYLRQHPDVFMSAVKETNWFAYEGQSDDRYVIRSRQAYERLFDGVTAQRAVGEASPQYLKSATAAERIAAELPGVRLVAVLRDPVDRAYSSYLHSLRDGNERRGAEQALQPGSRYVDQGLYHPQLSRYFERFERSRMKVILYDDLANDPAAVMRDLYAFLGIDEHFAVDVATRHNAAAVPRLMLFNWMLSKGITTFRRVFPWLPKDTGIAVRIKRPFLRPPAPLPPAIRRRLVDYFGDDIARTGQLIGRDLSRWQEP
jgi:hypothetical protein